MHDTFAPDVKMKTATSIRAGEGNGLDPHGNPIGG
jgi:hypothetical protein